MTEGKRFSSKEELEASCKEAEKEIGGELVSEIKVYRTEDGYTTLLKVGGSPENPVNMLDLYRSVLGSMKEHNPSVFLIANLLI